MRTVTAPWVMRSGLNAAAAKGLSANPLGPQGRAWLTTMSPGRSVTGPPWLTRSPVMVLPQNANRQSPPAVPP